MKVVVQRVKEASVTNDTLNNQIKKGYCLLVGIGQNSTEQDADVIAKKIANARLFEAVKIYEYFNDALRAYGLTVKTGEFGTHMNVSINNDGPVTIIYESQDGKIQ
ncbi:TPA: D-aminoacyl-tRNA deacylase [Staphylococcus aureus]